MQLSDNIRAFRKERSLTQEQLAQTLNVTPGAVHKWEAGLSTPDISLIVELAELFDTSVDALLGYEAGNNRREAIVARLKDYMHRRDERGLAEAEKQLRRYPNSFEIVYHCADLYWVFGFMSRDKAWLRRSIELMERACLLISQNTDPEISELSISHNMANAYYAMGEGERAVELLVRNNPRGVHNDYIGYIMATTCGRTGEAVPYLSRALLRCASSLTRVVIGYFHVYFQRRDFSAAAGILCLALHVFADLKEPGQNNYLDKVSTVLYVYLAASQLELDGADRALESLRTAKRIAEQFDRAPDHNGESLRFVSSDRPATAFDDLGATAMDCILRTLEVCESEALMALWDELAAGENRDG